MRYFNIAGECRPGRHYMLPAAERLPDARMWVEDQEYFIVHAPRQTGKTTTLTALAEEITADGRHVALRISCERGEAGPDDIDAAERQVLRSIRGTAAGKGLPEEWMPPDPWPESGTGSRIFDGLQAWSLRCPRPLVLLFDEIDALSGDSLNSVLRQIRDGFSYRDCSFPSSIALCGMRQLRDYKIAAGSAEPVRSGRGSPFNNAVESPRIADFTFPQVAALYAQHTADTGQEFTSEAVELAYDCTQGQPWLVNALAREITVKMRVSPSQPVTDELIESARERLIHARPTHLDSLVARLAEPRIRRVIEPLIAGAPLPVDGTYNDDLSYARDLGLIAPGRPIRIANPVYQEVVTRALGDSVEDNISADPYALLLPDGRLDIRRMLEEFTAFWLENGEWMANGTGYNEAGAQIVFMAFLQRMIGADGFIDREFAIGSGRADILIRRRYGEGEIQREAFELKVWWDRQSDPLEPALGQFDRYLARLRLDVGTLIIFDQRKQPAPVSERSITETVTSPEGRTITLLRR